jgi:hypothetical protein
MQARPQSQYLPIWNRLKLHGTATIVAMPALHRRIIKAVQKRRDRDLGFKLQLAEDGMKHEISWLIKGNTITFSLHKRISIYGI